MKANASLSAWIGALALFVGGTWFVGCSESSTPTAASPTAAPEAAARVASVTVGVAGDAAPALAPGGRLQLWAVAHYADLSSADVTNTATWQSSNPSIATVSRDGVLTAATEGAVDVVAAVGSVSGSLHATIARAGCDSSTVSPTVLTFNAFGHFAEVKITTPRPDCRWTAASDADWLRFNNGNRTIFDPGQSGSGTMAYEVLANNFPDARTSHVTISFTDGSQLLHAVAQERPVSCSYVVAPDDAYFRAAGGVGSFDVTATPSECRWTATTAYDFFGVRLTSSQSGAGSAHVTYVVTPTFGTFQKEATIQVAGLSGANPPGVHKIHIAPQ